MSFAETTLTIGSLAKKAGVGVETVRFYEREGLIRRPAKQQSGFRQYNPGDVHQIYFIKRAQELGFTLKEVKELLQMRIGSLGTCGDVKRRALVKQAQIEEKIADLKRMKRSLIKLSRNCSGGKKPTSECPILEGFEIRAGDA